MTPFFINRSEIHNNSKQDKMEQNKWIPIEKMTNEFQKVYLVCENPKYGGGVNRFQTIAEYVPYMKILEEDYMSDEYHGEGDYNEDEDNFYTPEGFYEWQSESDMHWKISAKITHFMPMLDFPELLKK